MTEVIKYEIVKSTKTEPWYKKLWNIVTFKKDLQQFEVVLTLKTSSGYYYGNLLMLDDYRRVIVLKSDGINVLVKTVDSYSEFKPVKSIIVLITRKWAGPI